MPTDPLIRWLEKRTRQGEYLVDFAVVVVTFLALFITIPIVIAVVYLVLTDEAFREPQVLVPIIGLGGSALGLIWRSLKGPRRRSSDAESSE